MAITQNTYTGDGSTTNYTFTFEYIAESDIKITLDGTLTTAYSLANATTVEFDSAPANGVDIRIYRQTDDASLSAQFYPGSAIRSQDLNANFTQSLYVAQDTATAQENLEIYVDETFVEDTRVHFTGDTWSDVDDYNIPTVKAVSDRLTTLRDNGFWDTRYYTETELNTGQLDNRYFTESELLDGTALDNVYVNRNWFRTSNFSFNASDLWFPSTRWIDTYYYTKSELDAGQLDDQYVKTYNQQVIVRPSTLAWVSADTNVPTSLAVDNRIIQLKDAGNFDDRYYTESEADTRFWNVNSTEYISSVDTWTPDDQHIATTAAIDARIINLVDGIGGFIPVATHTTLPADFNPDLDDDGGNVVVSIQSVNGLEHTGGGSTNATTIDGVTAYIVGIPTSLPSPLGDVGMLVTTSALSAIPYYIFHRLTPEVNDVVTVAQSATEVATVAGQITPVNNVSTVAAISTQVATVGDNASDVVTVANNSADVTTVAGVSGNVTTVAGISTDVTNVANNSANINTVADQIAPFNNVGTVAGISTQVVTVADNVFDVRNVANNLADVNIVATDITDVTAVSTNIGAIAAVGSDLANSFSNIDDYGGIADPVTSTPGGTSDIQTVATDITNVNTVAGDIANVNAVSTYINNVNAVGSDIASVNTAATNIAAIIAAPTEAANAANSASAAAISETNAAASATNAAASATDAASSAAAAASSAAAALVSETNADNSADLALQYRDDTAGLLTQADSDSYNVNTNQSWGDIIASAFSYFANEVLADTLLTMSKGTNTYDYGTI